MSDYSSIPRTIGSDAPDAAHPVEEHKEATMHDHQPTNTHMVPTQANTAAQGGEEAPLPVSSPELSNGDPRNTYETDEDDYPDAQATAHPDPVDDDACTESSPIVDQHLPAHHDFPEEGHTAAADEEPVAAHQSSAAEPAPSATSPPVAGGEAAQSADPHAMQVAAAEDGEEESAVVFGDRADLHVGDYVSFERISTKRDWSFLLGKVVGLPTAQTVRIAHYDPVSTTAASDPFSESVLLSKAEASNQLELWHDRDVLGTELSTVSLAEQEATTRLFALREQTQLKSQAAAESTSKALEALDKSRELLQRIPLRQWRDLRTPNYGNNDGLSGVVHATLLVLGEDRATSWDAMQTVMRQPNFLQRLLDWDCTVSPMSVRRRRKIVRLCAPTEVPRSAKKRSRRSSSVLSSRSNLSGTSGFCVAATGQNTGGMSELDMALRSWLNAQLACSELGESQERIAEECYLEQQEQRVLLREVNDMRVTSSRLAEQRKEMKYAILGIGPRAAPEVMPLDAEHYPVDAMYFKRTYPGAEGRFVQDIIRRDTVLVNFGPMVAEDTDGYVRLNKTQVDAVQKAAHESYVVHDLDEVQDLLFHRDNEEAELRELKARMDELGEQAYLSPEEQEELAQLSKLYTATTRRHSATLKRIAEMHSCGRGVPDVTVAKKKQAFKYTRLHCTMSGDWESILSNPTQKDEMITAFLSDLCRLLAIPANQVFDIDVRSGSLHIDFTVKHSGDVDDEELQNIVSQGDYAALSGFYEKVTFKKTTPLNTPEMQTAYDNEQRAIEEEKSKPLPELNTGAGVIQTLEDYYNVDGSLDEDIDEKFVRGADYRKAFITILPVRQDCAAFVVEGLPQPYTENEELPTAPMDDPATTVGDTAALKDTADEHTGAAAGLTETQAVRDSDSDSGEDGENNNRYVNAEGPSALAANADLTSHRSTSAEGSVPAAAGHPVDPYDALKIDSSKRSTSAGSAPLSNESLPKDKEHADAERGAAQQDAAPHGAIAAALAQGYKISSSSSDDEL